MATDGAAAVLPSPEALDAILGSLLLPDSAAIKAAEEPLSVLANVAESGKISGVFRDVLVCSRIHEFFVVAKADYEVFDPRVFVGIYYRCRSLFRR